MCEGLLGVVLLQVLMGKSKAKQGSQTKGKKQQQPHKGRTTRRQAVQQSQRVVVEDDDSDSFQEVDDEYKLPPKASLSIVIQHALGERLEVKQVRRMKLLFLCKRVLNTIPRRHQSV